MRMGFGRMPSESTASSKTSGVSYFTHSSFLFFVNELQRGIVEQRQEERGSEGVGRQVAQMGDRAQESQITS